MRRENFKNNTNLSLSEDRKEEKLTWIVGAPRCDRWQKNDSVKNSRFDELDYHGPVQSPSSGWDPSGLSNISTVQSDSYNSHKREENVQ